MTWKKKVTIRVSSELGIDPGTVQTAGKHPVTVKARSLMCYWAMRRLGFIHRSLYFISVLPVGL